MTAKKLILFLKTRPIHKSFAILLILFFALSGCTKAEPVENLGRISVGSEFSCDLAGAYLVNYGVDQTNDKYHEGTLFMLYLYEEGIELRLDDDGKVRNVFGEGYVFQMQFTAKEGRLPESDIYLTRPDWTGDSYPVKAIITAQIFNSPVDDLSGFYFLPERGNIKLLFKDQTLELRSESFMSTTGEGAAIFYNGKFDLYEKD